jgi:hypothetical protein
MQYIILKLILGRVCLFNIWESENADFTARLWCGVTNVWKIPCKFDSNEAKSAYFSKIVENFEKTTHRYTRFDQEKGGHWYTKWPKMRLMFAAHPCMVICTEYPPGTIIPAIYIAVIMFISAQNTSRRRPIASIEVHGPLLWIFT